MACKVNFKQRETGGLVFGGGGEGGRGGLDKLVERVAVVTDGMRAAGLCVSQDTLGEMLMVSVTCQVP